LSSPSTSFTVEQIGNDSSEEVPYGNLIESNKLVYPQVLGGFYSVISGQKTISVSEIIAGNSPTLQNGSISDTATVITSNLSSVLGRS